MAYADVDTAFSAAKTAGDLKGRIVAAMVRRAVTRLPTVANGDDQRELAVCRAVLDGTFPDDWVRLTMSLLDTAGQLASPTDAQLDSQIATAFARLSVSR